MIYFKKEKLFLYFIRYIVNPQMVSVTYLACESYKILSYFRIIILIFISSIIIGHANNVSVYTM